MTTAEAIAQLRAFAAQTDRDFEALDSLEAEIEQARQEINHLSKYADRGDFLVYRREWDHMVAEIERLRAVLTLIAWKDTLFSQARERALDALDEKDSDDVGPPAPGEGDELENPEIGMVC